MWYGKFHLFLTFQLVLARLLQHPELEVGNVLAIEVSLNSFHYPGTKSMLGGNKDTQANRSTSSTKISGCSS